MGGPETLHHEMVPYRHSSAANIWEKEKTRLQRATIKDLRRKAGEKRKQSAITP